MATIAAFFVDSCAPFRYTARMSKPLIIGNWKMNGSQSQATDLLRALIPLCSNVNGVDWVVCPPSPYFLLADTLLKDQSIRLGAQNMSMHLSGAHTGELSADILKDCGCQFVILGHSECRKHNGEGDAGIASKCLAAATAGLEPILCVGESAMAREDGLTLDVISAQLQAVFDVFEDKALWQSVVIAYEPVWAIGTGLSATPDQAQAVHAYIRAKCQEFDASSAESVRILYGGSVKPANAAALLGMDDINGALVGGASLDAKQFYDIGAVCNNSF